LEPILIIDHEPHDGVVTFDAFLLVVHLQKCVEHGLEDRFHGVFIFFPKILQFLEIFPHSKVD
jgi:hypothetical protein